MNELKSRIHDEATDLDYVLAGDYYIPAVELPKDNDRPIEKWGADAPGVSGKNGSTSAQPFVSAVSFLIHSQKFRSRKVVQSSFCSLLKWVQTT